VSDDAREARPLIEDRTPIGGVAIAFLFALLALGMGALLVHTQGLLSGVVPFALSALFAVIAVQQIGYRLIVWRDRFELCDRPWIRGTYPFSAVTSAVLREGMYGPRLTVRFTDGRKVKWKCFGGNGNRVILEPRIKIIVEALTAAGVEVDSLNNAGSGPFTRWEYTELIP